MENVLAKTLKKQNNNILASIIIFFFYSAAGALFPIFNLLFQEKGFNLRLISFLLPIPNLFILVASPIWASIADVFNIPKRILTLAMILTVPFIIMLNYTESFIETIVVFSLFALSFSPLLSMTDNAVLNILGNNQSQFGKIRVWGSVSYGISALIVGLLAESFGFKVAYWIAAISMLVTIFFSWKLPANQPKQSNQFWNNLRFLFKEKNWVLFLFGVFLSGYSQSIITGYFPAFLKNLGTNSSLIGFAFIVSGASELPIMLLSPQILKKISIKKLFVISLLALIIRNLLIIILNSSVLVILTQILHGLTSSLFWISAILYVRVIAPAGLKTTALALLGAIYYGFAGLIGSFTGGQIFSRYGSTPMFSAAVFAAFVGLIVFAYNTREIDNF